MCMLICAIEILNIIIFVIVFEQKSTNRRFAFKQNGPGLSKACTIQSDLSSLDNEIYLEFCVSGQVRVNSSVLIFSFSRIWRTNRHLITLDIRWIRGLFSKETVLPRHWPPSGKIFES